MTVDDHHRFLLYLVPVLLQGCLYTLLHYFDGRCALTFTSLHCFLIWLVILWGGLRSPLCKSAFEFFHYVFNCSFLMQRVTFLDYAIWLCLKKQSNDPFTVSSEKNLTHLLPKVTWIFFKGLLSINCMQMIPCVRSLPIPNCDTVILWSVRDMTKCVYLTSELAVYLLGYIV